MPALVRNLGLSIQSNTTQRQTLEINNTLHLRLSFHSSLRYATYLLCVLSSSASAGISNPATAKSAYVEIVSWHLLSICILTSFSYLAPMQSVYEGLSNRLVIAFDMGTTYSGVSYSILSPGEVPRVLSVTRYVPHSLCVYKD
jgi:hypothetical protein